VAARTEGRRDYLSAWEKYRAEADDYRVLDRERVLVLSHVSARGKTSGPELGKTQTKTASMFQIRGGKVTRLVATGTASAHSPTSASHRTPAADPYSERPAARNASP
jgi:hypothetical protein